MSKFRVLTSLLVALMMGSTAFATTVLKMDLVALTKTSDVIMVGKVLSIVAQIDGGKVHTITSIAPISFWKGQASSDRVVLRHLGGKTKELVTHVAGMPDFEVGETTLLFLVKPENHKFFIVNGLEQGKFRVEGDTVVSDGSHLRLVEPVSGEYKTASPSKVHLGPQSLSEIESRVARLVGSGPK